jgi:hypothetical protein
VSSPEHNSFSKPEETKAQAAVRAMRDRLSAAARSIIEDAGAGVSFQAPTGELFIRRNALETATLRSSRFRIDNRQRNESNSLLETTDEAGNLSVISALAVPSPSLAVGRAALASRNAAKDTSSFAPAIGADKAELEANQSKETGYLTTTELLPARGSAHDQRSLKRDKLKAMAISNKFVGKPPPEGYHAKQNRTIQLRVKKLGDYGNDVHYGNPQEVRTALDKPPRNGVLHAGGSINLGSATSLMSLSTLDASRSSPKHIVAEVQQRLGLGPRAQAAQYGIRKAVEHAGEKEPSFAESQQLEAWKASKQRNLYAEVEANKKQWYKSSSLFGRPEEPWLNGGIQRASEQLPAHSSTRPPKGFKRIRNGQVVYL